METEAKNVSERKTTELCYTRRDLMSEANMSQYIAYYYIENLALRRFQQHYLLVMTGCQALTLRRLPEDPCFRQDRVSPVAMEPPP
jgi:hypothetical protein